MTGGNRWTGITGAPGEIRTPDLLLRRLSKQPRPSQNQLLIFALPRPYAALSAPTEHILNTASGEHLQDQRNQKGVTCERATFSQSHVG